MIRTRRTTVGRDLERLLCDGVRPAQGDAQLLDRYLGERDEAAFEILVERHGPMILSLCRRYLRDPRDVEDAFQATFLVLARKGPGLRDKSSLSSWLYGVAYRVAMRARSDVLKRRAREVQSDAILQAPARPTDPPDDSAETLDAELSRLPEKYRAPLVLCHLEGRTHEQAAAELGWPVGTVRSRMARARSILEARLTRRGLDASACLAFLRPDHLITSTVLPTLTMASTSWPATALAQGVLATMLISQLKWIGVATAAVGLLAASAGMGAWAVNTPAGLGDDPRPVQESRPIDARPTPRPSTRPAPVPIPESLQVPNDNVQARLAEMERKLDRLMELLHRMEERPAPPANEGPNLGLRLPRPEEPSSSIPVAANPSVRSPSIPESPPLADEPPRTETRPFEAQEPPPAVPPSPRDGPREAPAAEASPSHALPSPREAEPVASPANRPDGPPQLPPQALPAVETVPVPSTVEVRLPSPTASSGSTPGETGTSRTLADLVLSRRERGSVREIEALLRNLYVRQQRNNQLRTPGVISEADSSVPTELARVLVAQLREMEDDSESDQRYLKWLEASCDETKREKKETLAQLGRGDVGRNEDSLKEQISRQSEIINELDKELRAKKRELEMKATRLNHVHRLIEWAEIHFKDLKF